METKPRRPGTCHGNKVYYGDVSRFELLHAAGIADARIFICAIGDIEASLKVVEHLGSEYPQVSVYARARNRQHAIALRALGAKVFMRDTLLSMAMSCQRSLLAGKHD